MFEKFINDGNNTFRQRYIGTYGLYHHNNKPPILVKLTDYSEANGGTVYFTDQKGIVYHLYANSTEDIKFEFSPPEKRWYPHKHYGAVLGYRRVQRQFQRGLCDANYSLKVWLGPPHRGKFGNLVLTFSEAANVLLKTNSLKTVPFSTWVSDFTVNSYYVDSQFCITRSPNSIYHLYLYDKEIAEFVVNNNKVEMKEENEMFSHEVVKVFNMIGLQYV